MIYDANPADDNATGQDDRAWREAVMSAVDQFNADFHPRGYDAAIKWHPWGDFTIDVSLDDVRIAVVHDDLDKFEDLFTLVDEGHYENNPVMEAA